MQGVEFPEEVAEKILDQIADGKPLKAICREPGMPAFKTVYRWIDKNPEFAERMEAARLVGADAIAEEALEIADDGSRDYIETEDGPMLDKEHVQRSKLRVWTRLQLLAKWHPKKYGQKIEHSGEVKGGFALQVNLSTPAAEAESV